jgi:hypothetical protein
VIRLLPVLLLPGCAKGWPGPISRPIVDEGTCFAATAVSIVGDFYAGLSADPPRLPAIDYSFRNCGDLPVPELPCEARVWVNAIAAYAPGAVTSLAWDPLAGGWPEIAVMDCQ